ncbi:MAG: hypothetical protein OEY97_09550 [Nitrospirota bacterium]|nr:hypothetical protein [Nitrospirota bacterium]
MPTFQPPHSLRADVVGGVDAVLCTATTIHGGIAASATDDAGEQPIIPVVELASLAVGSALVEDAAHLLEGLLRHDGFVVTVVNLLLPAELAHVDGVLKDVQDHLLGPFAARSGTVAGLVEGAANGIGALPSHRVHLEDLADQYRLFFVDDQVLAVIEPVAVRHRVADKLSVLGLLLHSHLGPLHDGGVLELGKHPEHLQHHLAGGVLGVKRLGDALEYHPAAGEFLDHPGKLVDLAGKPVDPEH